MTSTAEVIARARARRFVPNRVARPIFWRLAIRDQAALANVTVDSAVRFGGGRSLQLALDLTSRQNWLMLFEGFAAPGDGEAALLRFFCERAAAATCVVDVGVNHGLYTYHALTHCPAGCTIVGIEANPALVASVNRNLERNGAQPLVTLAALTDADGPVTLFLGADDMVSSLRRDHVEGYGLAGDGAEVEVPGYALDSLLGARGLVPDLIKIDVEGHERAVLAGAKRTLAEHRPALIIEVTPETFADVDRVLTEAGYTGRLAASSGLMPLDRSAIATSGYSNLVYEHAGR
jgi:FkbM family methyltransferase